MREEFKHCYSYQMFILAIQINHNVIQIRLAILMSCWNVAGASCISKGIIAYWNTLTLVSNIIEAQMIQHFRNLAAPILI